MISLRVYSIQVQSISHDIGSLSDCISVILLHEEHKRKIKGRGMGFLALLNNEEVNTSSMFPTYSTLTR